MSKDIMEPVIILVKSQLAENIGMSARAMFNCGVKELRLVAPRDGWPLEKAMVASAHCLGRMPAVKVFDKLMEATADLHYVYASTARLRHMNMPIFSPMESAVDMVKRAGQTVGQKLGIVFGSESSGLDNEDVAQCNAIVTIPLNPEFTSLNLAQAVLLLCWEWRKVAEKNLTIKKLNASSPLATQNHVNVALSHLTEELEKRGFFKSESSEPVVRRSIQAMFNRISMSEQEVQCLHGIVRCLTHFDVKTDTKL